MNAQTYGSECWLLDLNLTSPDIFLHSARFEILC